MIYNPGFNIVWGVRERFPTELGKFFEKATDCGGEDVEGAWNEFKRAVLAVTEWVVGRQRAGKHRKATSWWSSDVKKAVKSKKWLYRKALNDWTDESWKLYKEARKIAKQVVWETKGKDLVTEGKMLQKDYLSNRKRFWQKVKGEERAPKTNASIETKDGKVLTGREDVQRRWREHFSVLFQNEGRDCGRETQGDAGSNELDDGRN